MNTLFVCAELSPWVKTGGLGDIAYALPRALADLNDEVRILIPAYPEILTALPQTKEIASIKKLGGNFPNCSLQEAISEDGITHYLIDYREFYQRGGNPYIDSVSKDAWEDNYLRFGLLSRVAAWIGLAEGELDWRPDIIHCNDWHTGLAPFYLKNISVNKPVIAPKSIISIHNLAYQGIFPKEVLSSLAIDEEHWHQDGVEFFGNLSFLKTGIQYADLITTVSSTYAKEIKSPEFGCGLDKLLKKRQKDLIGIINGVDESWHPQNDQYLHSPFVNYNISNVETQKRVNKKALQQKCNLSVKPNIPIFGIVSRLSDQKGLDMVIANSTKIINLPSQIVVLGTGSSDQESQLIDLTLQYPEYCSVTIGFDEALAHQIEAGADFFLMPSRFEPCGLNQMYSQIYGTLPIVRAVGGLKDTVINYSDKSLASATGFVFKKASSLALLKTIKVAYKVWTDPKKMKRLIKNAMSKDFTWNKSAAKYSNLYRKLAN